MTNTSWICLIFGFSSLCTRWVTDPKTTSSGHFLAKNYYRAFLAAQGLLSSFFIAVHLLLHCQQDTGWPWKPVSNVHGGEPHLNVGHCHGQIITWKFLNSCRKYILEHLKTDNCQTVLSWIFLGVVGELTWLALKWTFWKWPDKVLKTDQMWKLIGTLIVKF